MLPRSIPFSALLAGVALALSGMAHAVDDAWLEQVVDQRLQGDRTGACFAVAVIERDRVARAWRCADPADAGRIGHDVAFEIGSVAKTMTAALLADLIERGEASLDDPLADYLPEGTRVPDYEGQPILLRHVVTHTSGLPALPPEMPIADIRDPYASLDVETALEALGRTTLSRAPGAEFEYSNFASMLLSYALARQAGTDFETLIGRRLFAPLGMDAAYVNEAPAGVRVAAGHTADAQQAPPWNFATDLAGFGGVRATLDDMVKYVQAHLELRPSDIDAALALTHRPLATDIAQPMAMNWLLVPLDGRNLHVHEGGTGGFSSFTGFDVERGRGVVVLSDTEQFSLGGLGSNIGMHLIDSQIPLGKPRQAPQASAEADPALAAYVGEYPLAPSFVIAVRERDGTLYAQATGQQELALEPAGEDVFAIALVGAELRFQRDQAGDVVAVELHQGGHVSRGEKR